MVALGKHRSRLQIVKCILSVIDENEKSRKTQIMYKAYLSYSLLNKYLNDVINTGLVVYDNENFYKLTSKGQRFLLRFSKFNRSLEVMKETLNHFEDQRVVLEEMCTNTKDVYHDSKSEKS